MNKTNNVRPINTSIEGYISSVDLLSRSRTDFTFTTSTPLHANIVISKIIEYSKNECKIYDDSLNGDITDQHAIIFDVFEKFFFEKKKLKMLLRNDIQFDSKIFYHLADFSLRYPNQIEIRLADEHFIENVRNTVEKDVNFVVNDMNGYRVENIESIHNVYKEAICDFNGKIISDKLSKLFDDKYQSCNEIILPLPKPI